jgi:hypothetical protein
MKKGGRVKRKMLVLGAVLLGCVILAAQAGTWELVRTEPLGAGTALTSENGRYSAKVAWGPDPTNPTIVSFTLAGPDGGALWSSPAFGENACFIANDGRTVVGIWGSGIEAMPATLTFYGSRGEKQAEVKVRGPSGTAFSQDGSTFFVRSLDLGLGAFDRGGRKLWQVPGGRLFTPSSDGKRLAVEDQGTLFLYEQGKLVGKGNLGEPFAVALSFSPDGGFLAAATSHRLVIHRARDLGIVWRTEMQEPGRSFTSVSLSLKAEKTAVGVDYDAGLNVSLDKRYPKGDAVLFGAVGTKLWTQEIVLGGFAPHRPLVSLSPDGGTIRVVGTDQAFVYEQK